MNSVSNQLLPYKRACCAFAGRLPIPAHVQVLNVRLVFDEAAVLRENQEVLQRALDLQSVAVHMTTDAAAQQPELAEKLSIAEPGRPLVVLSTAVPQQQAQMTDGAADPAQHIARLAVNGSTRT